MGVPSVVARTKAPLCKGPRSVGAVVNDMPVAYQSRAVTEPQREAVSRRLTEGLTPKGNSFISHKGVAKFYTRYTFVRLPGGGLLFYEEK